MYMHIYMHVMYNNNEKGGFEREKLGVYGRLKEGKCKEEKM